MIKLTKDIEARIEDLEYRENLVWNAIERSYILEEEARNELTKIAKELYLLRELLKIYTTDMNNAM